LEPLAFFLGFCLGREELPEVDPPRDESGNEKIPYRPMPYLDFTDRIPYFREKTKSGKNSGKFGENGNENG
jgi:hypothetical protein